MREFLKLVILALVFAFTAGGMVIAYHCYETRPDRRETRDSVVLVRRYVDVPVPRDSVVVRYITEKLPVKKDTAVRVDSVIVHDSVYVEIPITQKIYSDSLYKAYVSGYRARLDSIAINDRVHIITRREKMSRWSIGVGSGYGITPKGFLPYIGVSVNYRIL